MEKMIPKLFSKVHIGNLSVKVVDIIFITIIGYIVTLELKKHLKEEMLP